MKSKNIRFLLQMLAVVILGIGLAGCGKSAPTPEEVAKKINSHEELTQADYASILDYCGEYSKKAQQYYDLINNQPNDSTTQYIRASNDLADLVAKYQYLDAFRGVIYNLPQTALDEKNQKKIEEYSKYQGFPLPEGAGADLANPEVVGDIEDMPSQAVTDSTGVISTGDGVAVDENVGQ